jgi:ferredoxin
MRPGLAVITPREASILAALADAVAAPEPPLPPVAETDAAAAFDAWLAAAPPRNRRALRLALVALERGTGRRRFRTLDRAGRLRALRRLQRSRIPLVPQVADALRSAAVLSYHGDARVMATLGYDAPARMREVRARRPAASVRGGTRPAPAGDDGFLDGSRLSGTRTLRADVCVIGSGAGGAVVAKELAEGGARVVVLEEGDPHPAAGMTGRPRDMLARLYRDGGQVATLGRPPILLPLGRGVGGTTLVNGGTCFRTPDHVLAAWRDELGLHGLAPQALAPAFARVERTLDVEEVPEELAGANAALIRRGAERLHWSGGYLRRNAPGCQGSGVCVYGCPTGAKQHAGDAYLAPARAAGALTCTGTRAERIVLRGRRATGVEARTRAG